MFRFSIVIAVAAFAILLFASGAWAGNITIPDTIANATWAGYVTGGEDQEVETGMQTGQPWDLEAFLFDGSTRTLTMIAGWDFRSGKDGYASGDVFLATKLPDYGATIGPLVPPGYPNPIIQETFNYSRVLDIDWEAMGASSTANFTVRNLTQNTSLELAVYGGNGTNVGSNPYRWSPTSPYPDVVGSGTAEYVKYDNNQALYNAFGTDVAGITGGIHYSMTFNLTQEGWDQWITAGDLWTHFTYACGNDDMMGYTEVPVPEPMSMVMLGCLGAGMLGARKARKLRKAAK